MSNERAERIHEALKVAFSPTDLLVKDQSHLHAGHAGARDGKGHFEVQIVAPAFSGRSRIERHRMVHEVLSEMLETDIHALAIKAHGTDER
jgi:BolA protein